MCVLVLRDIAANHINRRELDRCVFVSACMHACMCVMCVSVLRDIAANPILRRELDGCVFVCVCVCVVLCVCVCQYCVTLPLAPSPGDSWKDMCCMCVFVCVCVACMHVCYVCVSAV